MIPIRKRLNDKEKVEYIRRVFSLRKKWEHYESAIHTFCDDTEKDFELPSDETSLLIYLEEYKKYPYLCKWILLSFEDIKKVKDIIDKGNYHNDPNGSLKVCRFQSIYKSFSANHLNNWIIEISNTRVCPYCNLAYTFNRYNKTMGQLDHFFPESEYPEFAICYYNLIPSCPTCNRLKGTQTGKLISPYEKNAFSNMRIKATPSKCINYMNLKEIAANIKILIDSDKEEELENVKRMNLDKAYVQMTDYAAEILKKKVMYKNESSRLLITKAVKQAHISNDEVLRFYFGNYLNGEMGMRIMDKLASDLINQDDKS